MKYYYKILTTLLNMRKIVILIGVKLILNYISYYDISFLNNKIKLLILDIFLL